MAEIAAMS